MLSELGRGCSLTRGLVVKLRVREQPLPNGSGKSTFFNLISSVYPPTSGSILFYGQDITRLAPHKIAGLGVARTFQLLRNFNEMTVLDNLRVGQHMHVKYSPLQAILGTRKVAAEEKRAGAAAAAGVNVKRYKLIAFVLGAAYAGCAGSLYAHMSPGYIHPNNFTVIEMVTLLLMVVLGGLGNIWGGIIGAVVVTIIFDLTREWYYYQLLMFGSVIVGTVMFMPKGIGGIIDRYLVSKRFVAAREKSRGISAGVAE